MTWLFVLGITLIILGFVILALSPLLMSPPAWEVRGGVAGCVVLFVVPICFGAGPADFLAVALAAVAVLMFAVALLQWFLVRRGLKQLSQ
ncbi:hypothetical protein [Pyrobaculum aerophilum]|uniref:DUF131 domain-containing protein n=2 Tax=Pyrobaculum aerophilum TaxID=13773 RepID=Q8ZXE9_PYRAE|nr:MULTISPECIES: hypothetical protein [Pyrobaculum]AAL63399.1 hypothetical protein PAE1318 [Pyrobaculum aerophilum str. IM2]MCX8135643.1 hypothetical protein [Pyrobaculum aerophilum]HII47664.1 hypothetical protein [Pyrobaculum aerophilum]